MDSYPDDVHALHEALLAFGHPQWKEAKSQNRVDMIHKLWDEGAKGKLKNEDDFA